MATGTETLQPEHHPELDKRAVCALMAKILGEPSSLQSVKQENNGPQGASGAQVNYFTATVQCADDEPLLQRFITKDASLRERKVLQLFNAQGQAIPHTVVPDSNSPGRFLVYQEFTDDRTPGNMEAKRGHQFTVDTAEALASIHAANLGKKPDWLPAVTEDIDKYLYLREWREEWTRTLDDPEFRHKFGHHTEALEKSYVELIQNIVAMDSDGRFNTVLSTDLNPSHIRVLDGKPRLIDWEQAAYGPLYLDLVNYFDKDSVSHYRDALAVDGVDILEEEFMDNFSKFGKYMGLRHLGLGIMAWREGQDSEKWKQQKLFFELCLKLALEGR
jgi:aminoglycoside phosphotransferase (APT) family kinase protein